MDWLGGWSTERPVVTRQGQPFDATLVLPLTTSNSRTLSSDGLAVTSAYSSTATLFSASTRL
ncbi:MAG: hypothetical protein ABSA53_34455 [Streptosporangiaceae bacterium]